MLRSLSIQDVVLIEKLSLPLENGLCVLTGETGAGKSILLDALALALGARSEAGLLRKDAAQASVAASFETPPESVREILSAQGIAAEDPLILRRTLAADGKSRGFINDQPVSVGLLKQVGALLVEVHGQFTGVGLLDPETHRGHLDDAGGYRGLLASVTEAYAAWQAAEAARAAAEAEAQAVAAEESWLRAAVDELNRLAPESGEAANLAEKRTRLQQREKFLTSLQTAHDALTRTDGAESRIAQAQRALARLPLADLPSMAAALAALDRAAEEMTEAERKIAAFLTDENQDAAALETIEERLFALKDAARKHGISADELPMMRERLSGRLSQLDQKGERQQALAAAVAKRRDAYAAEAAKLTEARRHAAQILTQDVMAELPALKFEKAVFSVQLTPLSEAQWGPQGAEGVTFLLAANPGQPAGLLHKVASGGELSRLALALKLALKTADPVPVLVFDEVDAGVGGATAAAVGERLRRLSEEAQVMVVTHSPQVAAHGHWHLRVAKHQRGGKTTTSVQVLSPEERREELARMLAGEAITAEARAAADRLLADVAAPSAKRKRHGRLSARG